MKKTCKMQIIVDKNGKILAAKSFLEERDYHEQDDMPTSAMLPCDGQHEMTVDLPEAVLSLCGSDFHNLVSQATITPNSELQFPEGVLEGLSDE